MRNGTAIAVRAQAWRWGRGTATLRQAADQAATTVEEALLPIAKLQDGVRDARGMRDVVAKEWKSALAALRLVSPAPRRTTGRGVAVAES